jgi:hemerythrin
MIQWKPEYSIGVAAIDEQHQKLFDLANQAYALLNDNLRIDKYDAIVAILGELKEYTVYHFKSEEDYMLSIGYKRFFSQKVEHDDFIAKIDAVNLDAVDAEQEKYLLNTLDFVCTWISDHILKSDKLITAP